MIQLIVLGTRPTIPSSCRIWQQITRLKPSQQFIPKRHLQTFESGPRIIFSPTSKVVQRLHQKDGIPPSKYELIYRCTFPNYVLLCQSANCFMYIVLVGLLIQEVIDRGNFVPEKEKTTPIEPEQPPPQAHKEVHTKPATPPEEDSWRNFWGVVRKWNESDDIIEKRRREQLSSRGVPPVVIQDLKEEAGVGTILLITFVMASLMYTIVRFQRAMPMRIYTSKTSAHSIGVYLGHVVPGLTTQQEFVAGTLTRAKTSRFLPSTQVFQDAAGRRMIFWEKMFRYPADFNRLLGLQKDLTLDIEEELPDEHIRPPVVTRRPPSKGQQDPMPKQRRS